jgi:hypothetical protein
MFDTLLQYNALQKILMNTLLVSIPEEFYLVMFTLILVGEFEYWKEPECKRLINKFDYVRVFLPTIVTALLSEILRNISFNSNFLQFIPFIIQYIIIVFTNDIFGDASALKWMGKAFISMLLGFLTIGLSEFVYVPFVLYGADLTLVQISNNILLYFISSLPSRILQYSLLLYLVNRRRTLLKGRLLKPILSNPILLTIFAALVLLNITFIQMVYKAIVFDEILVTISHSSLVFILIGVVLFPILNISGLLWGFYYMKDKETSDKKIANEKLNILLEKIELFTNNDNYDNIRWKLNEIGMGIEEVADSLYRKNETDKHK